MVIVGARFLHVMNLKLPDASIMLHHGGGGEIAHESFTIPFQQHIPHSVKPIRSQSPISPQNLIPFSGQWECLQKVCECCRFPFAKTLPSSEVSRISRAGNLRFRWFLVDSGSHTTHERVHACFVQFESLRFQGVLGLPAAADNSRYREQ